MKKISLLLFILFITSCNHNVCDEGYKEHRLDDGTVTCLPDYVFGSLKNLKFGNLYYHHKYGTIRYNNKEWFKEDNGVKVNPEEF